jgi:hypothetical protein
MPALDMDTMPPDTTCLDTITLGYIPLDITPLDSHGDVSAPWKSGGSGSIMKHKEFQTEDRSLAQRLEEIIQ